MSEFSWLLGVVVLVPLLGSIFPFLLGLKTQRIGWSVAAAVLSLNMVIVGRITWEFLVHGRLAHYVAGVPAPYGIELVVDGLSVAMLLLISAVSLGVLVYSWSAGPRSNVFYSGYLLLTAGLMGVCVTGDVFNLYVFLEISGLTAYSLVASGRGGKAAYAALKYLLIGTLGASLYLIGVGYALLATGTLNMADLAVQLQSAGYSDPLVLTAFGFIVAGLSVKMALYPMHSWQPDAYSAAPTAVTAYISALVSSVAAYALARVVLSVFTVDFVVANEFLLVSIQYFACISIVVGSVLAVIQSDVKRMLAYSSVSQFGLILAGFTLANHNSVFGGVLQLVGHGVIKGALFICLGVFALTIGAREIDDFRGVGRRSPLMAAGFGVLGFSLVGVPPSVGFMGKWYIGLGAVQQGAWLVAAVIVLSTLLTLAYILRLIDRMYFAEPVDIEGFSLSDEEAFNHGMLVLVVSAAILAVVLGLSASSLETVMEPTLEVLVG